MRVLFLRTDYGQPDSRCEKEIYSLSKENDVNFLGWDRSTTFRGIRETEVKINDRTFTYHHIGIKAPFGKGIKGLFFPLIRFWIKEWRILKKEVEKYDAIHACDFDAAFPILFLRDCPPLIYDIFDYYSDTHPAPKTIKWIIRKLENWIIRKSNTVIICSEARKNQILPEKPAKLLVIHNTPSQLFLDNKDSLMIKGNRDRYRIVYVGALLENRFLKEMTEVIINRNDVELHIGGQGMLDHFFESQSKKHGNIIYYGKMKYGSVLELEEQSDIMTAIYDPRTSNHKYAAPNKFYEALMLKKPIIMMRDTGMDSYVEKYGLGEVIDGGVENFKEGFSHALDNLIARKEQWKEMGVRGHHLYEEQFSWDEMERRLLDCYRSLPDAEL